MRRWREEQAVGLRRRYRAGSRADRAVENRSVLGTAEDRGFDGLARRGRRNPQSVRVRTAAIGGA
jgi:hypothetical protein